MFTAAQPGQGGVGHINCQEKIYWQKLFKSEKLLHCIDLEQNLLNYITDGYHMGWFAQNLLIYQKP